MLQGLITFFFLIAGVLTLVIGSVLVLLYRRAVKSHMNIAARPAPAPQAAGASLEGIASAPPAGPSLAPRASMSGALPAARAGYLRAAAVYTAAGLVHAAISLVLYFLIGGIEFSIIRITVVLWAFAWPIMLTLILFWGPDRRRQGLTALIYFVGLFAVCFWIGVISSTPPLVLTWPVTLTVPPFVQPLLFWAMTASNSLFLIVFLNRRVRNVGPMLLLFMSIAASGAATSAMLQFSGAIPLEYLVGISFFLQRLFPGIGEWSITLAVYGPQFIGAILFALPAWFVVRWIARRYAAGKISDQAIMLDSLWLLTTVFHCSSLISAAGAVGWIGLLAFAGYKLVVVIGLAPLQRAAAARHDPPQLLLLRTFGTRRRSERLFDLLATRWRYGGNIQLIAGPDLASTALTLHDFLDFVSGRLRRNFIHSDSDLERRLAAIRRTPDPDGRFRIDSFFCAADTWQQTVTRLIGQVDVVLMDLRGFTPRHAGCRYELGVLFGMGVTDRVVLLVDRSTDQPFLEQTLRELSQSPAADATALPRSVTQPHLLRVDSNAAAAVGQFLEMGQAITGRKAAAPSY